MYNDAADIENTTTDTGSAFNSSPQPSVGFSAHEDIASIQAEPEEILQGYSIEQLVHLLVVLATKMRHTGTYSATEDMSEMIEVMKDYPGKPQSAYALKKIIKLLSSNLSIHHFCEQCGGYGGKQVGDETLEDGNPKGILKCESCGHPIDIADNWKMGNTFMYLSLRKQLAEIFGRNGDSIIYSGKRVKDCSFGVEDIYDGRMYRKNVGQDTISINFSVDGVPIFDSSKYGMTPVLCTINELNPAKRLQTMLLCCLYCGTGKVPNMNAYLTPFVRECNELRHTGFTYTYMGNTYTKKCPVLCGVCDALARRELLNIT